MDLFKIVAILTALALPLSACQKKAETPLNASSKKITVITTLFPLYDFARNICGDKGDVKLLLPPGVEAHSFEPKPSDLIAISKGDVFVYTNPVMEPWAEKTVKSVATPALKVVDASIGTATLSSEKEEHGGGEDKHQHEGGIDPHLWLDFKNAEKIVDTITAAIIEKDRANSDFYRGNAAAYKSELAKLDADFSAGLQSCRIRTFVHGGHYAFGYLAHRYGLSYNSAQAINPDAEPTPGTIAELLKLLKSNGLRYVYAEELLSPRISEMLSREAGVKILTLHGAHNISKNDLEGGATFIGLMRKNLESLRVGLECR